MPLVAGGFKLTWKLPVVGNRGAAGVGVGLPPLEGGTTISANDGTTGFVEDVNTEAHAVEDGGYLSATERISGWRSTARWWTC